MHVGFVVPVAQIPKNLFPEKHLFPRATYLEFSLGEENYFRKKNLSLSDTLSAIFLPTGNIMRIDAIEDNFDEHYAEMSILKIKGSKTQKLKLLTHIHNSFIRNNGEVSIIEKKSESRIFFKAFKKYHFFYTCNTWIADIYNDLGWPMSWSTTYFSKKIFKQASKYGDVIKAPNKKFENENFLLKRLKSLFSK